uniref:Uncharacterized protein n=1 Tax=uncultured prokaryote TaxID=198431 RepID=H5S8Z6_9ZZZZ|nr:hypothetical protein HGMM_F01H12C04 [uncultured prokaryote]
MPGDSLYLVLKPLNHGGKRYAPGEIVDLSGVRTIQHLINFGWIMPYISPDPAPAVESNQEQAGGQQQNQSGQPQAQDQPEPKRSRRGR